MQRASTSHMRCAAAAQGPPTIAAADVIRCTCCPVQSLSMLCAQVHLAQHPQLTQLSRQAKPPAHGCRRPSSPRYRDRSLLGNASPIRCPSRALLLQALLHRRAPGLAASLGLPPSLAGAFPLARAAALQHVVAEGGALALRGLRPGQASCARAPIICHRRRRRSSPPPPIVAAATRASLSPLHAHQEPAAA